MSYKWTVIISVFQAVAVPFAAWVIRMVVGDTKNENEKIISDYLRTVLGTRWGVRLE